MPLFGYENRTVRNIMNLKSSALLLSVVPPGIAAQYDRARRIPASVYVRVIVLAFCLPAIIFSISCDRAPSSRNQGRPNVLLISIDTFRADHIHGYGYEFETTPTLDKLMRRGASFSNAISPSPWTLPSHVSLFTSLYPHTHGVIGNMLAIGEDVSTLPPVLSKMGYAAAAFTTSPNLSPRHGYAPGFDTYVCKEVSAPLVCEQALKWLNTIEEKNFFLFLHLYDIHTDYTPLPKYLSMFESSYEGKIDGKGRNLYKVREGNIVLSEEDIRHLIALYDAEIRQLDASLGTFFKALEHRNILSNTIVVITSDHGEEFLEHGDVLHGRTLYDELIKIPLIIAGPGIPSGRLVKKQVELIDVMPTILELCGAKVPPEVEGRSLLPLLAQEQGDWTEIAFAEADHKNEEHDVKRAIRTKRYKLYYDRLTKREELYDIILDPAERQNIVEQRPDVAKILRAKLKDWMNTKRGHAATITLSEKEKDRLRALGYLN